MLHNQFFIDPGDCRPVYAVGESLPDVSDRPTNCRDSREFLSKLMAALRQSVHQGTPAELDPDTPPVAPPEVGTLLRHM